MNDMKIETTNPLDMGNGNWASLTHSAAPLAPHDLVLDAALKGLGPDIGRLNGARVLITGARGFFGRFVVNMLLEANKRKLTQQPMEVIALDSLATGGDRRALDWMNVPNLTQHYHDVRHGLPEVVGKPLTHVWHLAGIASPYWYKKLPEETVAVTVDGTRNMLALAKEHNAKFLFTSSSEVYQTAAIVPTPETYIGSIPSCTDRSCYDVSKLLAETLCYIAATKHEQHASVVRIFNSFGPSMEERDKRILPRIASAMVAGREMTVFQPNYTHSLPRRTYTPVANTLLGFMLVALRGESVSHETHGRGYGIYNIGLDSPELSVPELISECVKVTGRACGYKILPAPDNYETEPLRRCPDITALKRLGFRPCMMLDTGLKAFFDWAFTVYTGAE